MIVGTAGHIDHGKTSLVKALTGIDADRLKEEKERGITVDLGFAYQAQADGQVLGFVDVPGHEKLVRTAAAKSAMAGGGNAAGSGKKEPRRKPGARECMQISRKFGTDVIDQRYFDILMDYSKRAKVDHLIRMRERLDEHTRFLEAQLAGLESLVKKKGEWEGKVPAANPKAPF